MKRSLSWAALVALTLLGILSGVAIASDVKDLYMSDAPGGPARFDFPPGTQTVYVNFSYAGLRAEAIRVRVTDYAGHVLFDQSGEYTGTGTASVAVSAGSAPFPPGPYVTVLYYAGGYLSRSVEWTIGGQTAPPTPTPLPPPTLRVQPSHLTFATAQGEPAPPAQLILITNAGGDFFYWRARTNASWLRVEPPWGAAPALARVQVQSEGLPAATYGAQITVVGDPGVQSSPQVVQVTLNVAARPGTDTLQLAPEPEHVGWVVSSEETGNHLGAADIWAGIRGGAIYHGALQFTLTALPTDAQVHAAAVVLTGRSREHSGAGGTWALQLVEPGVDQDWAELTYDRLHQAEVLATIPPVFANAELGNQMRNHFVFTSEQLELLRARLATGAVSFRVDGPLAGPDNVFIWHSGSDEAGSGAGPMLLLNYSPPALPESPTPTPTPTTANVSRR